MSIFRASGVVLARTARIAPKIIGAQAIRSGVRPYALNPDRAKALWVKSEERVGERF